MGVLTHRERQILTLLREGARVRDIAKRFRISPTSVSRSISNIRRKAKDVEEEVRFLCKVGYFSVRNGGLVDNTRDGDPKSIARRG